jgi:hypothetical protein
VSKPLFIFLHLSRMESTLTGVSHFKLPLKRGLNCTAVYVDGKEDTQPIRPEQAAQIRAYAAYERGGPYADAPNAFAILGEIQANRREENHYDPKY